MRVRRFRRIAAAFLSVTLAGTGLLISTTPAAAFPPLTGTCKATVMLAGVIKACVNKQGNLLSFDAPPAPGNEMVQPVPGAGGFTDYAEGYSVCVNGDVSEANDVQAVLPGTNWAPPVVVSQPNPGQFPITTERSTADGMFLLRQLWQKTPTAALKVTMTLSNLTAVTQLDVRLSRSGSLAPPATAAYLPAAGTWVGSTTPFAAQIVPVGPSGYGNGIALKGITVGSVNTIEMAAGAGGWSASPEVCDNGVPGLGASAPDTLALRVRYALGDLAAAGLPGDSATVVFKYLQI